MLKVPLGFYEISHANTCFRGDSGSELRLTHMSNMDAYSLCDSNSFIELIYTISSIESMGFITGRERQILRLLKGGRKGMEIADELGVKMSSISRSISNVRHKCMEIEDDVDFLQEVGFLDIVDGDIEFISRDPKDLRPRP